MEEQIRQTMQDCTSGSLAGQLSFPEVVARLAAIGCEQYHADFRRHEKTYYMPEGDSHIEPMPMDGAAIGDIFSADAVVAALREVQAGRIDYREFLRRTAAAGCTGYIVYIVGRCALYLGRRGDRYLETFPPAP